MSSGISSFLALVSTLVLGTPAFAHVLTVKQVLRVKLPVHVHILHEHDGQDKRDDRQRNRNAENNLDSELVRIIDDVAHVSRRHAVESWYVRLGVSGDTRGEPFPIELERHHVLERGGTDADAERHPDLA